MGKLLTAGLCLMVLGGLAQAQVRQRDRVRDTDRPRVSHHMRKASHIMGSRVTDRDGVTLGKVTDLVIDEDGFVDYLVVRYKDELLAVPWGAARFDLRDRVFTITGAIRRERLKEVLFPSDRWPDFYSPTWLRSAREVWGERALRHRDLENRRRDLEDRRRDVRPPADRRRDRVPPRPVPPPPRPIPPAER